MIGDNQKELLNDLVNVMLFCYTQNFQRTTEGQLK